MQEDDTNAIVLYGRQHGKINMSLYANYDDYGEVEPELQRGFCCVGDGEDRRVRFGGTKIFFLYHCSSAEQLDEK